MLNVASYTPARQGSDLQAVGVATFRAFYEDALPRIYGYLLRRCAGDVAVAEDLTQETFLAAVAELKRGRRVETAIPWIYGIARHKLLDHYRRQERGERVAVRAQPEAELTLDVSSDEVRERALVALTAVGSSQRAALVLKYLDGLSLSETADALGKSVEAVESLLARGRVSFKRAYLESAS